MEISGKVVVVTGAGRGIGLELTRQLAAKGNKVFATARKPDAATDLQKLAQSADVTVTQLDVDSPSSIVAWAADLKSRDVSHVDYLFNNAGILEHSGLDAVDSDEMLRVFNTNAVGPLLVVQALNRHGMLGRPFTTVIANISSEAGSVHENAMGGLGGYYSYRASKSALNIITKSMSIDLAGQGVQALVMHPGFVRTEMVNGMGNIDAATSAAGLISQLESGKDINGKFIGWNGEDIPW